MTLDRIKTLEQYRRELERVNWHPELEDTARGSNLAVAELDVLRQYRSLSPQHAELFDTFQAKEMKR